MPAVHGLTIKPKFRHSWCHKSRVWVFVLCLLITTVVTAQDYQTKIYTEAEGLPSAEVKDITQDDLGRLWFATRNGLAVYDGAHWVIHGLDDGLPAANYRLVRRGHSGQIWAAAEDRVSKHISYFDGDSWYTLPLNPGAMESSGRILDIQPMIDQQGDSLVVFIEDAGLFRWREGQGWISIPVQGSLEDLVVYQFALIQGQLYGATSLGLLLIEDQSARLVLAGEAIYAATIGPSPFEPENQVLWLWSESSISVYEANQGKAVFTPRTTPGPVSLPHRLTFDGRGKLFYANKNQLYFVDLTTGSHEKLDQHNGFAGQGATAVFRDREDILWIGSPEGITKVNSFRFANIKSRQGLLDDEVSALLEWKPGEILIGQNRHLALYRNGEISQLYEAPTDRNDTSYRIMDLEAGQDGTVWIAGSKGGLGRLDADEKLTWFSAAQGLKGWVATLAHDSRQQLWLGTNRGLYVFTQGSFKALTQGSETTFVRQINFDDQDRLYAATARSGLLIVDQGRVQEIRFTGEDQANNFFSVLVDRQQRVWVGSLKGLFALRDGTLHRVQVPFLQGRPVYLMIEDGKNNLWLGTDNGVIRWDYAEEARWFTRKDGLAGTETNRAAGLTDASGQVWVGMEGGLSRYQARYDHPAIPVPRVSLQGFEINGQQSELATDLELARGENNLTFAFLCVSFFQGSEIQYQTLLKGYERDWSKPRRYGARYSRYTSLPAGSYQFQVRARNEGGPWSDPYVSPWLTIRKPFWLTWWFLLVALLFVFGLVLALHNQWHTRRISTLLKRRVEEQTRELTAKNEQLHSAKDKAEAGSRAKSEFLATMSHEIRTPLNGVIATANLLKETTLNKEQSEYAEIITLSGEALLAVINDILDFSKIESGEIELLNTVYHPRTLLEDVKRILDVRSSAQETTIQVHVGSDVPEKAWGDANRLRQILLNLTGNAIKFTPSGQVHLSVTQSGQTGRGLRYEVRDTGIGIHQEDLQKLFRPFSQLDTALNRKFGGTGLGLVITKRLVEILGGDLQVESTFGKGSRFFFSLPFHQDEREKISQFDLPTTPMAPREDLASLKILAAEDNEINRRILGRMLRKLGTQVDLVENGLEAVIATKQAAYDVILMDIQMPEMDGLEATKRILTESTGKHRPRIIACTANATGEERARCLAVGMDDFLVKPLKMNKVVEALAQASVPEEANNRNYQVDPSG